LIPQNASTDSPQAPAIDIVIIGRNAALRLEATFGSIGTSVRTMVYVDSGSTDSSVAIAERFGALVVHLDTTTPFTAARARNAGLAELAKQLELPQYVQFIDGDCALAPEWIPAAREALQAHPEWGAVCGRRRERFPSHSIYNKLCDWEWDTPIGPAQACGGDMLVRFAAISAVGGYRDDVIAAEDNEVCQRLIQKGWKLQRLDGEMTLHDANIHAFSPWWKRSVRAGHGFAQVGDLHPGYFSRERRRVWLWAVWIPLMGIAAAAIWLPLIALPLLLYGVSFYRCLRSFRLPGFTWRESSICALLIVLSKFPNLQGIFTWWRSRIQNLKPTIIEYK
jgi:cellulose synthase/poly-beta-1,6-N-acetylglucosamine synthase-like glycosyltransferase